MRFSSLTGTGLLRDQPFKNTKALPWHPGGTFSRKRWFYRNVQVLQERANCVLYQGVGQEQGKQRDKLEEG